MSANRFHLGASLRRDLAALAETRRRHGFRAAIGSLADWPLRKLLGLHVARLQYLDLQRFVPYREVSAVAHSRAAQMEFRFLTATDVDYFARDPANDLPEDFAQRVAIGSDACYGGIQRGCLRTYGWYSLGHIGADDNLGVSIRLPAGTVYAYKAFTRPEWRGQRLAEIRAAKAFLALREQGMRAVVASVHWAHWASLKNSRRLGYVTRGFIVSRPGSGSPLWFATPGVRSLGLEMGCPSPQCDADAVASPVGSVAERV